MPATNRDWYNLNCARSWPLDERSTQLSDAGVMLPDDIIADIHLRFPSTAGPLAFVSGVVVGPRLVSVVICAADSEVSTSGFVPLASVTLPRPVEPRRPYAVSPMLPGVGGWLVFGSGVERTDEWSGRFSLPTQSLLMSRLARSYRAPPISSISRKDSQLRMTGLIGLSGGNDIEIVKQCLEIPEWSPPDGQSCDSNLSTMRNVVVFRLKSSDATGRQRNVLDIYRGPCGKRPESRNCGDPPPIEFIGPVQPDCCGNVVIEFRGCADLTAIDGEESIGSDEESLGPGDLCGAILDCPVKISQTCGEDARLPDEEGNLPSDYGDLCREESSTLVTPPPSPEPPPDPTIEESVVVDGDSNEQSASPSLPFVDDFQTEVGYEVVYGEFGYEDSSGDATYGTHDGAGQEYRNLAIWNGDDEPVYRRAITVFEMLPGMTGLLHSGGLAFGFRMAGETADWWQAEIDWDGYHAGYQAFRIAKYDEKKSTTLVDQPVAGLRLGEKYRITVTIVPDEDNPTQDAWAKAVLDSEEDPGFDAVTLGWLQIPLYVTDRAHFGMSAFRSVTRFHLFSVDNTTDLGGMA